MKYSEEGLQNVKGNLRAHSIQELSSALEQLLTELPNSIASRAEIKYPMFWEVEDLQVKPYVMELTVYVDTVLSMTFRLCSNRNITLPSFSLKFCTC